MDKELDELSTPAAREQFKKDDAEVQVRADFYRYQLYFCYYDLFQRDVENTASTGGAGASKSAADTSTGGANASTGGAAGSTATS